MPPTLREALGEQGPIEITLAGQVYPVQPFSLLHIALLEDAGVSVGEIGSGSSSIVDIVTAMMDEAGHLGLPAGATWTEKRRLVAAGIRFDELPALSDAVTKGLPPGPSLPKPSAPADGS